MVLKHDCASELSEKVTKGLILRPYPSEGLPRWFSGKEPICQYRSTQVRSLGQEDPLEKETETHSSILTWKIPWTEEPDGL